MARRRRMTQDEARRFALTLPQVHEDSHHGRADIRVRNKIFMTLPESGDSVVLKSDPANSDAMIAADPETYRDAWGGRWVEVDLSGLGPGELRERIVDAWCRAAPKRLVTSYRASHGNGSPRRTRAL